MIAHIRRTGPATPVAILCCNNGRGRHILGYARQKVFCSLHPLVIMCSPDITATLTRGSAKKRPTPCRLGIAFNQQQIKMRLCSADHLCAPVLHKRGWRAAVFHEGCKFTARAWVWLGRSSRGSLPCPAGLGEPVERVTTCTAPHSTTGVTRLFCITALFHSLRALLRSAGATEALSPHAYRINRKPSQTHCTRAEHAEDRHVSYR